MADFHRNDRWRRVLDSQLALSDNPLDRQSAYRRYVNAMNLVYKWNKDRFDDGRIAIQDLEVSRYYMLDAEMMLLRATSSFGHDKP